MTRVTVLTEGVEQPFGIFVEKNALSVKDDRIPVTFNFDYAQIAGIATDFQRNEETGELSFELTLSAEVDLDDFDASVFVAELEGEYDKENHKYRNVSSGVIRSVVLVSKLKVLNKTASELIASQS